METATGGEEPRGKGGVSFRPLLLEVAGSLDDAVCAEVMQRLRDYRNRYTPILRLVATLVAPPVAETELFANGESGNAERRNSAPRAAITAERHIVIARRLHEGECPIAALEAFMAYRFLPLALTHNTVNPNSGGGEDEEEKRKEEEGSPPFVLRHYVHEVTRTASFLVADLAAGTAVLIDPQHETSAYEEDLARFGLRLVAVVLTHCFVDIALGHATLLAAHPSAVLVSGDPGAFEDTCPPRDVCLSSRVTLRAVPVPSFSPESLVVELRVDARPLALFTGTVLGTDSVPRVEFFSSFPGCVNSAAAGEGGKGANAHVELVREMLFSRVLEPYATGAHEHLVLFPSHGGYSNVSHQLDLHWAAHMGDLRRAQHDRAVHKNLRDADAFAAHLRSRPPLPTPPLFAHIRAWNATAHPAAFGGRGHALPVAKTPPVIVIDTRDGAAHAAGHIAGSVSVPMSFPAAEFGAKKAELWLQCLLQPRQPIVAVVADAERCGEVRLRLALISPDAPVEALTAGELQEGHSRLLPQSRVRWVTGDAVRLERCEHLRAIEPSDETVVLDCRTHYEFRNGSHPLSANVPLSDLCEMTGKDTAGEDSEGPSSELGIEFIVRLCEAAITAGASCAALRRKKGNVVVYCAGGYRSLIAASLLRRAFEAAAASVNVCDVAGGALQIMQQRPDLWTVKDRSILCVS